MKITNNLLLERLQHLETKGYAENTIESYFTSIKLFFEWMKNRKSVDGVSSDDITLLDVDQWKIALSNRLTPKTSIYYSKRPNLSQSTIQSKLTAIKSLLKYLNYYYDAGIDYRKIETKKIKSDYIQCITDDEFNKLKTYISLNEKYRINALRMQLLVNIGYTSGLRLSEILGLTISDIKKREIKIVGKGNKARRVFFTHSTEKLLDLYINERSKPIPRTGKVEKMSDFVFISHNSGYDYGKPIKKNTVCEIMKKYSDGMNIGKRITVHTLRHSYATKLLENGLNIREIQELLGHKDIQTTEGYCHVLKSNLGEKVKTIFS